jgi:hypothetical protein
MSHVRLTVDNQTWMDDDTGHWSRKTPEKLRELQTRTNPQPWMKAALITMTEAIVQQKPITITVTTTTTGFTITTETP